MKIFTVFMLLLVILGFGGFSFFNLIKNENAIFNQNTVSNFDCNDTKISAQKILILSETTHGSENINELKNCLFKRLIISKKYDTLVFEYDYSVMSIVDSYINNRINLNESELRGFFYNSFYNSVSFFNLIEFLRIYNHSRFP